MFIIRTSKTSSAEATIRLLSHDYRRRIPASELIAIGVHAYILNSEV